MVREGKAIVAAVVIAHHPPHAYQIQSVALAMSGDAEAVTALLATHSQDPLLNPYQPLHAARAHVFQRLGHFDESRQAYATAIALSESAPERNWL